MMLLGSNYSFCCHAVKSTIMPHDKLRDAIINNMLLNGISQRRQDL